MKVANKIGEGIHEVIANEELAKRVDRVPSKLGPYGVDPFGFDPEYLKKTIGAAVWVYRHYFRCQSFGVEPERSLYEILEPFRAEDEGDYED